MTFLKAALLDKSKGESHLDVFRLFKGDVATLLRNFERKALTFDTKVAEYYQPGNSATSATGR